VSAVVGFIFLTVIVVSILNTTWWPEPAPDRMDDPTTSMSTAKLGLALLGFEQATPPRERLTAVGQFPGRPKSGPAKAPYRRQMSYLLPFEIVSVHLLVVLLGAAYLARAKRRRGAVP
jgi:hypothetical protein